MSEYLCSPGLDAIPSVNHVFLIPSFLFHTESDVLRKLCLEALHLSVQQVQPRAALEVEEVSRKHYQLKGGRASGRRCTGCHSRLQLFIRVNTRSNLTSTESVSVLTPAKAEGFKCQWRSMALSQAHLFFKRKARLLAELHTCLHLCMAGMHVFSNCLFKTGRRLST